MKLGRAQKKNILEFKNESGRPYIPDGGGLGGSSLTQPNLGYVGIYQCFNKNTLFLLGGGEIAKTDLSFNFDFSRISLTSVV